MTVDAAASAGRQVTRFLLLLVLARLLLQLLIDVAPAYGMHHSELYYAACGARLAPGYLDLAPLLPWLAALGQSLFGEQQLGFRLPATLAAAALPWLAGWAASLLGGGRYAQLLAGLAVLVTPVLLLQGGFLSRGVFESLLFSLAAIALIQVGRGRPRWWLLFGLAGGLGLLVRSTQQWLLLGLLLAVLLTHGPRIYASRWSVIGLLLGLLLASPYFAWQVQAGFPGREYAREAAYFVGSGLTPPAFAGVLAYLSQPVALPLWLGGLCWLFFAAAGRAGRPLGWVFLAALSVLFVTWSSRPDRLAPLLPVLFAASAVGLEGRGGILGSRGVRLGAPLLLLASGILVVPLVLPILAPQRLSAFCSALRVPETLVYHFRDRLGWESMAAEVVAVWDGLPAGQREGTVILAGSAAEAAAIEFYARDRRLPAVHSGHNGYFVWGPPSVSPERAIAIGWPVFQLHELFDEIVRAGVHLAPGARPQESRLPIFVCRRPKKELEDHWPRIRSYHDDHSID